MHFVRESVFISALRTFCSSIGAILGIALGGVIAIVCLMLFSRPEFYQQKSNLSIAPDAQGNRDMLPASVPVILKIDVQGVIGMGDLTSEKMNDLLLDSREGILGHERVKGILLYLDTPGGEATNADNIYQMLLMYKKKYQVPVYAFVNGLCASGGMYIASAADQIFATPTSVIGSVGIVIPTTFNFSDLMTRYGIQSLTISEGKDKDMLNPFRPWTPGEDASLKAIVASLYVRFVDTVCSARPQLSRDKLISEYGAQVYVAEEAQRLGYIDHTTSDYNVALQSLVKAAGIQEEAPYQVMGIEPVHSLFSELTQSKFSLLSGKVNHTFELGPTLHPAFSGKFLYLYQP